MTAPPRPMATPSPGRFVGGQFPSPPPAAHHLPVALVGIASAAVSWILTGAAAVIRAHAITSPGRTVGIAVATTAFVALLIADARRMASLPRWALGVGTVVLVAAVSWCGGRTSGLLWVLGAASAAVLARVRARGDARRLPVTPVAIGAMVAVTLWAGRIGTAVNATVTPLIPAVAATALALVVLVAEPAVERVERSVAAVGRAAIQSIGFVLIALIGVVAFVPSWLFDRLTGWDPLAGPSDATGWVPRRDVPSLRSWTRQRDLVPVVGVQRLRRTARRSVVVVAVVAAMLAVGLTVARRSSHVVDPNLASPAMAGSRWYPEFAKAAEEMVVRQRFNSYVSYEMPEVRSPYLNVVDGRRRTWAPPAGACTAIEVWTFGGSTTFGDGQRDDHTIPSELARLAWAQGIRLDVENFGAYGDTNWIETRRLEVALSTGHRPDVVTFLDGWNEFETMNQLNRIGRLEGNAAVGYVDSQLYPLLHTWENRVWGALRPSDRVRTFERSPHVIRDPDRLGRMVARQYRLGVDGARRVLEGAGIDAFWFDQPTIYTRALPPSGEAQPDASTLEFTTRALDTARSLRPPGVVDITDAVNAASVPVFRDPVHTNELGARLVAEAMFDELLPTLRRRCEQGRGCC